MTFSQIASSLSALITKALSLSTLAILSLGLTGGVAQAQLKPPVIYTLSPTGVDLATSSFTTSVTDLSIGPLSLERSYVTADGPGSWSSSEYFGYGWTHNFDIYAREDTIHGQNSSSVTIGRTVYKFPGWPTSTSPEVNDGVTLALVGGALVFTDKDGTIYQFLTGSLKISTITHPDGSSLTFSYVSNTLKTIVSNRGYALVFDYSSALVSAACGYNLAVTYVTSSTTCGAAVLKVGYGYTSSKLTAVTDVMTNVSHYTYTSGGYLTCLTDPGTTTCKITNTNGATRSGIVAVTSQVTADNATWSYACDCGLAEQADPDDLNPMDGTRMTEPNSATVDVIFTSGSPSYFKNENGKVYTPSYAGRTLLSTTSPEGNAVTFSYNANNVESKRTFAPKSAGLTNIDEGAKTFPASCTNPVICNLPLTVTDAKGAVTAYSYDSTHGGVLTEIRPADGAGVSAVVRHAYAQKSAFIKNSGGTYSAAAPIWVLTEDRTCRTTATVSGACAGGSTDEVVTTYEYGAASGPNNLLLLGIAITADGTTRRTCFGYDWMGNRISTTAPRAGLTACS
ncbi:MAG: hypothetical protein E7773_00740 [Sphingomonas sp.]|uniref:hypothetical protein n=1 Tax=Sphingomonas sp. TaxID=28214 RepID=UPI00121E1DC2|nr:hypothetical protein [Sphingomonas sp.]THD38313.1 MAG: hypothetical protein E7773_00740 [Sphingomonas sp.]